MSFASHRRAFSRRDFVRTALMAGAGAATLGVAGCGSSGSSSGGAPAQSAASASSQMPSQIVIGTMPTEDTLPYYLAAERDLFAAAGIDARIEFFQSAQELSVAITSGDVRLAMTDPMVAASLFASGVELTLEWVTLGMSADEGRFGVQVGPDSEIERLADLAGVPVGVGSNTVPEYVFDVLMQRAGVAVEDIKYEEIKKLPVRYQMMESGQVAAAALPGSMLALGEARGCRTLADDSTGENVSASIMIAAPGIASGEGGAALLASLEQVWDEAAAIVNADPESCRATLITGANLSDEVADTYPVPHYPEAQRPPASLVTPILDWMLAKGYLTSALAYDEPSGSFSAA